MTYALTIEAVAKLGPCADRYAAARANAFAAAHAAIDAATYAEEKWQLERLVYWLTDSDPQPLPLEAQS